jgi:hypothetical protein
MNIWDLLDQARHKLTVVQGLSLGRTTYWCEGCGGIFIVHRLIDAEGCIFQGPEGSPTKLDWCSRKTEATPLKDKLDELNRQDMERLRDI